jgi:hypothetical protein
VFDEPKLSLIQRVCAFGTLEREDVLIVAGFALTHLQALVLRVLRGLDQKVNRIIYDRRDLKSRMTALETESHPQAAGLAPGCYLG